MTETQFYREQLAKLKRDADVAGAKLDEVRNALADMQRRVNAGQKQRIEDVRHLAAMEMSLEADIVSMNAQAKTLGARLKDAVAGEIAELNKIAAELAPAPGTGTPDAPGAPAAPAA